MNSSMFNKKGTDEDLFLSGKFDPVEEAEQNERTENVRNVHLVLDNKKLLITNDPSVYRTDYDSELGIHEAMELAVYFRLVTIKVKHEKMLSINAGKISHKVWLSAVRPQVVEQIKERATIVAIKEKMYSLYGESLNKYEIDQMALDTEIKSLSFLENSFKRKLAFLLNFLHNVKYTYYN